MIDVYRRGYANHSGFIGRADPVALSRSNGDRMQEKLSSIPLIPRRLLLGNPAQIAPDISPDGSLLSWLAPADGVMNVWYAPSGAPHEAKLLTRLSGRPIAWHKWSPDGRRILFLKDLNGDENYNIHTVDIASGEVRNLTPMPKVAAQIDLVSPDLPRKLFAGLNDRDPQWHDIWEIDLETGERKKLYENTERLGSIQIDWQGKFRLASRANPETGGEDLFRFRGMSLEPWRSIPFEDSLTTSTGAFNRAGTHFAMISSVGRNTSALLRVDAATGEEQVLAADPEADIVNYMIHPETFEVVAAASDPGRLTWTALDPQTAASLNEIKMRFPEDDFAVSSRSRDNSRWIVSVWGPQKPVSYYLADRTTGGINGIFSSRPDLKPYRLAPMKSEHITSRDGLTLHSYLTLPPQETGPRPAEPLPMVLLVHGGPWSRDSYGYNRLHQWLANRGYAVLSVNYRASAGFGKAFLNAGDKEHAGKIHDDLIDGVNWAIGEGIAIREKVAIMGWSYGGYSAFVGATFSPDVFCCSIPVVGITELITLLENTPPYWTAFLEQFYRRYADPRTEEGRAFLRSRSPLYKADNIKKPMLIAHGANDIRCPLPQSDAIVETMQDKGIPVTYVVFPDEGHGFARPENNIAFHAIAEAFLAKHLGGRAEPVGKDFEGSSHEVRADDGTFQALGAGS
jgi:acylaminoacyl-peptidase